MEPPDTDRYRPWRARRFEAAEIDSSTAPPGVDDYLENAFLYRRIPPVSFNGEPVDTTMRWFAGSSAAFLHAISRNPGMTGRRKEDDDADSMDGLLACFVTHGRMEVETDGRLLCLNEGDVFTLDTAVPHVMRNYPGHVVAIFVPRSGVVAAVDAGQTEGLAGRAFTDSDLADLFGAQVRYMVRALGEVSPQAFDVALTASAQVALAMIRQDDRNAADAKSNLIARVRMVVAAAATDPALTTAKIADMLNVSRTSLYDAFSSQGLTVAAYLRDHRLRTFLELLRETPDAPIQALALKAGFGSDASDFTKLFRRVYGMSPSEMRVTILNDRAARPSEKGSSPGLRGADEEIRCPTDPGLCPTLFDEQPSKAPAIRPEPQPQGSVLHPRARPHAHGRLDARPARDLRHRARRHRLHRGRVRRGGHVP